MSEALITPKILQWARERSNITLQMLAEKTRLDVEKLAFWENGETKPTFSQAKKLARALNIPFGFLFLPSPPEEKLALPDLRTIPNSEKKSFSAEFKDHLNDVLRKHEWYRDYLIEEGAEPLDILGKFSDKDDPKLVAYEIGIYLEIDSKVRQPAADTEDFLRKFIRIVEDEGILVLRSGIVGNNSRRKLLVEEFRGFAISDDIVPLIFLNARDAKSAQIFTLAHELAHLWIGESGISNPNFFTQFPVENKRIEKFCNHVSAELLVPEKEFLLEWDGHLSVDENLYRLGRKYRVSSLVILRRAFELGKINRDDYVDAYETEVKKFRNRETKKLKSAGGDFYLTLWARNSRRLTTAIISATLEDRLRYPDAAKMLNVRVQTLEKIASKLESES